MAITLLLFLILFISKVIRVHGNVQLENKDLPSRSEQDSLRNESGAPHLASSDKTTAVGLTASPFSCAPHSQENSEINQNDNKIQIKGTKLHTEVSGGSNVEADATKQEQAGVVKTEDDALATCSETPNVLKTQLESRHLTPQELHLKSYLGSKDNSALRALSGNDTGPLVPDSHPTLNKSLIAQEENTPLQSDTTFTSVSEFSAVGADNTKAIDSAHCVTSLIELPPTKPDNFPTTASEHTVSNHLEAQLETFKANTNAQGKHCKDDGVATKKVFTVVLDMDPQDIQQRENSGLCSQEARFSDEKNTQYSGTGFPEMKTEVFMTSNSQESDKGLQQCTFEAQSETCEAVADVQEKENFSKCVKSSPAKVFTIVLDIEPQPFDTQKREKANSPDLLGYSQETQFSNARPAEVSSRAFPQNKSGHFTTLISAGSDEVTFPNSCASPESNPSVLVNTVLEEANCSSAKLPCRENHKTHGLKLNKVSKSSKSCCAVAECQHAGAQTAETTFPDVKLEETTDFCDSGEQTESTVDDSVESGEALNGTHIFASGKKQVTPDSTVCNTEAAYEEVPKGENTEEANEFESTECKVSELPVKRYIASLPKDKNEGKLPAALEDMGVTQEQVGAI